MKKLNNMKNLTNYFEHAMNFYAGFFHCNYHL